VFARSLAEAVGADRIIAAVDSRGGQVVIHGWKTPLPITAVEAVPRGRPFCGEFLYTHVDTRGLMGGTDIAAILAVPPRDGQARHGGGGSHTRDMIVSTPRRSMRWSAWRSTRASSISTR